MVLGDLICRSFWKSGEGSVFEWLNPRGAQYLKTLGKLGLYGIMEKWKLLHYVGDVLGLYWGNGKENGNSYIITLNSRIDL